MNNIQTIPLNKLVHSKANVRKTGADEGIGELAASIAAVGLRQNLNVRGADKGRFEVVAGGRRLRALKTLVKEGLLAKDAGIPCRVMAADEDPAEISLTENTQRLAMHPDDQFVAFQLLVVGSGKSIEDVAARFGVTPAVVERRLKLAKVSPKLRTAFRKGDLTLEQMMAFTVSDDHDLQEEVYQNLANWNRSARDIRAALTQEAVALTHALAKFVTAEVYVAAGGVIQRDLFDTANEGYMPDRVLVLQLAQAKLEAAAGTVKAEGWKWVKAEAERDYSVSYGRVYPTCDHQEDDEDDEAVAVFEAEDMANAGAIVRIGHDGELAVERGLVHPEDRASESGPKERKKAKEPGDLPATLIRELSAHRTAGLQAAMAHHPDIALAATVTALALPMFYQTHTGSCLDISLRQTRADTMVAVPEECEAHAVMASERENWGERLPGNPSELLDWCVAQPQDILLQLLAFCAACSLNAVTERVVSTQMAQTGQLASLLGFDMAAQWKPTVEGFYGRLNKATMVAMVQEAKAPLSIRLADVKKDTAARHVMEAMAETNWLPPILRASQNVHGEQGAMAEAA